MALIAGLSVAAVLVVGLLALSLAVRGVDTIYNGIAVNGVELGGMTQEEANQALLEEGHQVYDNLVVTVSLPLNNLMTITAQEAGVQISAAQAAQAAWNYGRDGGLLKNLFRYIGCRFLDNNTFAYEPWLDVTMDEAAIRALVAEKSKAIDEALLTSGTDIREEEIRVVKGAKALPIDEEEVFQLIRQAFLTGDAAAQIYEAPVEVDESFDFQALYDQVYAEVKDAELDEETGEVIPSVTGVTFDIAAAEKKWAEAEYGEEVIIPLILDEPEVSTEDLSGLLFRDVLSMDYTMAYLKGEEVKDEVRTSLAGSTANRISNVELACASINGIILQPGDEFSFNDALGERTAENGVSARHGLRQRGGAPGVRRGHLPGVLHPVQRGSVCQPGDHPAGVPSVPGGVPPLGPGRHGELGLAGFQV